MSGLLGEYALADYMKEKCGDSIPTGFMIRIGIDKFSAINANFGTSYGDFILKELPIVSLSALKKTRVCLRPAQMSL